MERRYLAATIAMAATFALFSHAFGSGLLNRVHDPRATLISEMHCAAQTLRSRLLDKVNRTLGAGNANAEEAQLRVELNLPALPAPAAPALPAKPMAFAATAPVAPAVACPSQRLTAERMAHNFERAQARQMAMQSQELTRQAKLMAVQARLTSQAMQREMARAVVQQARASLAQVKVTSHSCNGEREVRVVSRSDSGDEDMNINVDVNQLSRQIEDQVSRSLRNSVRNF